MDSRRSGAAPFGAPCDLCDQTHSLDQGAEIGTIPVRRHGVGRSVALGAGNFAARQGGTYTDTVGGLRALSHSRCAMLSNVAFTAGKLGSDSVW